VSRHMGNTPGELELLNKQSKSAHREPLRKAGEPQSYSKWFS